MKTPTTVTPRYKLPVYVLFAALMANAGCSRTGSDPVSVAAELAQEQAPDEESWDVRFSVSHDGAPRVNITAPYMAKYTEGDSTYALLTRVDSSPEQAVFAELFDRDAQGSTTIRANELRFFESSRRYELRGNVEVVTSSGRELETDFLIWNERAERVLAPGFVRITSPTENLQGYGLDSDEMLENFRLSRVTGRYYVEE